MRKEAGLIAGFTAVMSAVGFLSRWLQNGSIYEAETMLPSTISVWSTVIAVASVAAVAVLLVLSLRLEKYYAPTAYREALRGNSILFPAIGGALGLLAVIGAVMLFIGQASVLTRVLAVLALISGVSLPVIAMGPGKGSDGALICLFSIIPVAFMCFWLIVTYKDHSSNPVVWMYAFEILAISAMILAYYFTAGYAYGKARPRATIFCCAVATFFCVVTLADDRPVAMQLIFAAFGAYTLALSSVLIINMK